MSTKTIWKFTAYIADDMDILMPEGAATVAAVRGSLHAPTAGAPQREEAAMTTEPTGLFRRITRAWARRWHRMLRNRAWDQEREIFEALIRGAEDGARWREQRRDEENR